MGELNLVLVDKDKKIKQDLQIKREIDGKKVFVNVLKDKLKGGVYDARER